MEVFIEKKENDTDVRRVGDDVCGTTDRVVVGLISLELPMIAELDINCTPP